MDKETCNCGNCICDQENDLNISLNEVKKIEELEQENELERKRKKYIAGLTNKEKFKKGIWVSGYKAGFTKQTLEKRKKHNRLKNKIAKQSRKRNR